MKSDWPITTQMMRYALQGRAPFEWIGRGRICYVPYNYTPTTVVGTSEIAEHLNAHLAGIDAAIGALISTATSELLQEDGFSILTEDGFAVLTEGGAASADAIGQEDGFQVLQEDGYLVLTE